MSQLRIKIRSLRLADTNDIHELLLMPNVLWGTAQIPSTPLDARRQMIETWLHDPHMHVFITEIQEKAVGMISLQVGENRQSHVGTLFIAVHDKYQNQGLGKMLMMTVIDLADNWLNLARLELDVSVDNERAIHLFQHFDFEVEGRKRMSGFRGGQYTDSYLMARLRPRLFTSSTETVASSSEPDQPAGQEK